MSSCESNPYSNLILVKSSTFALYKNIKVAFNLEANIFLRKIGNFIIFKKKSTKKRLHSVNIRPVSFEIFRMNQFV